MRERRGGGEAAPRGPQALDVLFILGETRDRRAAPNDPVGVADVRRDLIGRALHLDEENGLALRKRKLRFPQLDRLDRAAIEELRSRGEDPGGEEIIERCDRVFELRVPRK